MYCARWIVREVCAVHMRTRAEASRFPMGVTSMLRYILIKYRMCTKCIGHDGCLCLCVRDGNLYDFCIASGLAGSPCGYSYQALAFPRDMGRGSLHALVIRRTRKWDRRWREVVENLSRGQERASPAASGRNGFAFVANHPRKGDGYLGRPYARLAVWDVQTFGNRDEYPLIHVSRRFGGFVGDCVESRIAHQIGNCRRSGGKSASWIARYTSPSRRHESREDELDVLRFGISGAAHPSGSRGKR